MDEIEDLISEIVKFRDARDWKQFHNSKDLATAINIEASELLELFLWKDNEEFDKEKAKEELADILIYCLMFAEKNDFDFKEIVRKKLTINSKKYPINKAKGSNKKYRDL